MNIFQKIKSWITGETIEEEKERKLAEQRIRKAQREAYFIAREEEQKIYSQNRAKLERIAQEKALKENLTNKKQSGLKEGLGIIGDYAENLNKGLDDWAGTKKK